MKIEIDKINYFPGENIRGKLVLSFNRPVKARSLSISFVAEKNVVAGSGDNSKARKYAREEVEGNVFMMIGWNVSPCSNWKDEIMI